MRDSMKFLFVGDSITDGCWARNCDPNHILGHGFVFYAAATMYVKYAAQRFNNYRPYVLAGIAPMVDLTVRKQKELLTHRFDLAFEMGFGCDFYLPFFKLIPELKFCFGLTNLLVKERGDLIDKNLLKYTQSLDDVTSRMLVLTLYFE